MAHPGNDRQLNEHHKDCHRGCDIETGQKKRQGCDQCHPARSWLRRPSPRNHGVPRPVRLPSSDSATAKPMLIPAPSEAPRPTANASHVFLVAKAAAKTGANVETEPSIRPARPGCTICNTNRRPLDLVFFLTDLGLELALLQLGGTLHVRGLGRRQVIEQLADAGILGARCGVLAEAPRLGLHRAHLRPNLFQPQRRVHPNRLAMHEPANVVPPDQRNVPAEFLLLQLDQTPAVANLFLAHLLENLRRAGKVPPQVFTKIGVDTFRPLPRAKLPEQRFPSASRQ